VWFVEKKMSLKGHKTHTNYFFTRLLKIVSHSLEYLLQNYVKIFLITHLDNAIKF